LFSFYVVQCRQPQINIHQQEPASLPLSMLGDSFLANDTGDWLELVINYMLVKSEARN